VAHVTVHDHRLDQKLYHEKYQYKAFSPWSNGLPERFSRYAPGRFFVIKIKQAGLRRFCGGDCCKTAAEKIIQDL
jgi:hypothetical protein